MIQKPVIGIGICGGLFSVCTLMNAATVMQAIGGIAAGSTAILIFIHTVWKLWRGKQ